TTGGFFGVPRCEGDVDLSIRVYASVMNPVQAGNGQSETPTGGTDAQGRPNEWNGFHQITKKNGIHKTLKVNFASPSRPALAGLLPPGIDGQAYRNTTGGPVTMAGAGGVALLIPDPVNFQGVYPSNPVRAYEYASRYWKDQSYPGEVGDVVEGELPNALTLDGNPNSTTNGQVTGTPFDRGFHPVEIDITDHFYGNISAPDLPGSRDTVPTPMTLSISPDNALYMRGLQTSEGSGGQASGLLDKTNQMGESRMVPLFLQSALFATNTGEAPDYYDSMPAGSDILPVMLLNSASAGMTERNEPVIGGFWPAEAGKENDWYYYGNRAWKDTQQELTWVQIPNEKQTRVFLWGETVIRSWNSRTSTPSPAIYSYNQRFQQFDTNGDRGVLIVNPGTGEYWMPARLDNGTSEHGLSFGSEYTQQQQSLSYYEGRSYAGFYYYSTYPYHMWMAHSQGLGVYMEDHGSGTSSSNGWNANSMGRTAVSVAASADGLWCATALMGGGTQKILIWRTDGAAIDGAVTGQAHVTPLTGKDQAGADIVGHAAIIDVGGDTNNSRDLLPDSLKFVDGGLVFLKFTDSDQFDYSLGKVFGFNLVDGSLSVADIDNAVDVDGGINNRRSWGFALDRYGIFIPDQDAGFGNCAHTSTGAQFAFAGNEAAAGSEGPTALAFIAGDNLNLNRNTRTSAIFRLGFEVRGNRQKSLYFMEVNSDAGTNGLSLGNATITDLSGTDSRIYGDFLPPGRRGEGRQWLKVSNDGSFVAVARDWDTRINSTFYGSDTVGSGYYYNSSSSSYGQSADDLLVFSTPMASGSGVIDMDSDKGGRQHVLFIGTNTSPRGSGSPGGTPSMPTYASARNLINGQTRKVSGIEFSEDNRTLLFDYAGDSWTRVKHTGYVFGWGFNAGHAGTSTSYNNNIGLQQAIRFHFRDPDDGSAIDITDTNAENIVKNIQKGMTGRGGVGDTTPPFTATRITNYSSSGSPTSDQLYHYKFRSQNGDFLYYIVDRRDGAAYMFGVNMTGDTIVSPEGKDRDPYEAFVNHGTGVSFEQFEYKGYLYNNRIVATSSASTLDATGRDGTGLVFIIGSDAASSGSATNLEIYCMRANDGGDLIALTGGVTTGASNAINYMYPSMDGSTIVAQRSSATNSRDDRSLLTTANDLICVNNIHQVMFDGATPNSFVVSPDASHGSTVAFVGDGTGAGPVALVFSRSDGPGNTSWEERNLFISLLAPQANRSILDATDSHYTILSGARKLDDDPNSSQ
ncbi:MAG: hypothetical protein ACYTHK_18430, partial [Planctomycetota bacterium]